MAYTEAAWLGGAREMIVGIAKPLALLLSMLSLYRVFHAAFLTPATTIPERGQSALLRLAVAGTIALAGGLLFREQAPSPRVHPLPLTRTLPIQLFCWATACMSALFAASWYVETYCILYRDVRY